MKSRRRPRPSSSSNRRVNERAERRRYRHVLDVAIPASRREREIWIRQGAGFALRAGLFVALGILLIAGGRTVFSRALERGESLVVSDISVWTNGALSRAMILAQARVAPGDRLLGVGLHTVRERLEELPQVASAQVTRKLPGSISITVDERDPLAWLSCPEAGVVAHSSGSGFLVDKSGRVYRCEVVRQSDFALPVVNLHDPTRVRDGVELTGDEAETAFEIIRLREQFLPDGGWDLSEVELVNDYSVRATFANGASVLFGAGGAGDLRRQFSNLAVVAGEADRLGQAVATVNLLPRRNVPVTFFTGDADPPPRANLTASAPSDAGRVPADRRARSVRAILGD